MRGVPNVPSMIFTLSVFVPAVCFRSYCFFDFEKEEDGDRAVKELNNQMFMGYRVTVQLANSDPKTPDQMVRVFSLCCTISFGVTA